MFSRASRIRVCSEPDLPETERAPNARSRPSLGAGRHAQDSLRISSRLDALTLLHPSVTADSHRRAVLWQKMKLVNLGNEIGLVSQQSIDQATVRQSMFARSAAPFALAACFLLSACSDPGTADDGSI